MRGRDHGRPTATRLDRVDPSPGRIIQRIRENQLGLPAADRSWCVRNSPPALRVPRSSPGGGTAPRLSATRGAPVRPRRGAANGAREEPLTESVGAWKIQACKSVPHITPSPAPGPAPAPRDRLHRDLTQDLRPGAARQGRPPRRSAGGRWTSPRPRCWGGGSRSPPRSTARRRGTWRGRASHPRAGGRRRAPRAAEADGGRRGGAQVESSTRVAPGEPPALPSFRLRARAKQLKL